MDLIMIVKYLSASSHLDLKSRVASVLYSSALFYFILPLIANNLFDLLFCIYFDSAVIF